MASGRTEILGTWLAGRELTDTGQTSSSSREDCYVSAERGRGSGRPFATRFLEHLIEGVMEMLGAAGKFRGHIVVLAFDHVVLVSDVEGSEHGETQGVDG